MACSLIKRTKATHLALCSDIGSRCLPQVLKQTFKALFSPGEPVLPILSPMTFLHLLCSPTKQVCSVPHSWASACTAPFDWSALPACVSIQLLDCPASLSFVATCSRLPRSTEVLRLMLGIKLNLFFKHRLLLSVFYLCMLFENGHFSKINTNY